MPETCIAQAMEICDNAIDDDGDGFIDINDTTDCKCKGIKDSIFIPSSLIPNPSFELYNQCPDGLMQLNRSVGWIQASSATSDYFNLCGFKDDVFRGTPPQPLPAGRGYVGFLDIRDFPQRGIYKEYIGACLTSTMAAGKEYTLTFWVGFGRRGQLWGPRATLNMAIFASSRCSNLPFGIMPPGYLCPTRYPGWFEMSRITVSGNNQWRKVVVKLRPTVNVEAIVLGPACAATDGDYYYWLDELILEETVKFDSLKVDVTGNFCVDTIQLKSSKTSQVPIDYQWYRDGTAILGANQSVFNIPKGDVGKYVLRVSYKNQCEYSKTFDYKIDQFVTEFKPDICPGDTVQIAGKYYTKSGNYRDTLKTNLGCDSIIDIKINEFKNFTQNLSFTICKDDSLLFDGTYLKDQNVYPFQYFTSQGCDSTVIINLKINTPLDIIPTVVPIKCSADSNAELSIKINGGIRPYKLLWHTGDTAFHLKDLTGGSYFVDVYDSLGCHASSEIEIPTPPCFCFKLFPQDANCVSPFSGAAFIEQLSGLKPKEYILNGNSKNIDKDSLKNLTGGTYDLVIIDSVGCEFHSNFVINIDSSFVYNLQMDKVICSGDFVEVGGKKYFIEGNYIDSLLSFGGCDSIVSLNLKVNPIHNTVIDSVICDGSFVEVLGKRYTKSGSYNVVTTNEFSCDSSITLNLLVNPIHKTVLDSSICDGEFVKVGDIFFSTSGNYEIIESNQYNCDSSILLNLIVNPLKPSRIDTSICSNQKLKLGTKILDSTGLYTFFEKTYAGCDSTVVVNLKVASPITIDPKVVPIKCASDSNAQINILLSGGTQPYRIKWHTGDTLSFLQNITSGYYYVEVIDAQGCIVSKEIEVQGVPCFCFNVNPIFGDCIDPDGGAIFLQQISGMKAREYLLNGNPIVPNSDYINGLSQGSYDLTVIDSNGCIFNSRFDISFDSSFIQEFGVDTVYATVGDSIELLWNSNGTFDTKRHHWTGNGTIFCQDCKLAKVLAQGGETKYIYSGKDENGCEVRFAIVVIAKQGHWVPNVFSPNGDGINDYFNLISDSSIGSIDKLQIYSRWGELIFQSENGIPNTHQGAWNGFFLGQPVNPGVFVYAIYFHDKVGKAFKLSGDLTVVK